MTVLLLESGAVKPAAAATQLSDAEILAPALHDPMSAAVARRLGGTSHLWGARCVPYDEIDFEPRPALTDATWPITFADAHRFLDEAVEATRSGRSVYRDPLLDPTLGDSRFECDNLERWANIQQASRIHQLSIKSEPRLDVRTGATAVDLHLSAEGAVTAVEVASTLGGQRVTAPIRRLILACGGLETTRLLLTAQLHAPERFGGVNGALGRYYMGHLYGEIADITFSAAAISEAFDFYVDRFGTYVRRRIVPSAALQREHTLPNCAFWPVVPPIADARHRDAVLSSIYLAIAAGPFSRLLVPEAISKRHIPTPKPPVGPHLRNVATGAFSAAAFTVDFFKRRYFSSARLPGFFLHNTAGTYGLSYHAEQMPSAASRVTLSSQRDRLGVPKLSIDYRVSDFDVDGVVRTHDHLEAWLKGTRLASLAYRGPREERHAAVRAEAGHGTHQIGLTRMASDPKHGVVDSDLRVFGSSNLFIASTSVLPTSSQANPTLTALALALRLGDKLRRETA